MISCCPYLDLFVVFFFPSTVEVGEWKQEQLGWHLINPLQLSSRYFHLQMHIFFNIKIQSIFPQLYDFEYNNSCTLLILYQNLGFIAKIDLTLWKTAGIRWQVGSGPLLISSCPTACKPVHCNVLNTKFLLFFHLQNYFCYLSLPLQSLLHVDTLIYMPSASTYVLTSQAFLGNPFSMVPTFSSAQ